MNSNDNLPPGCLSKDLDKMVTCQGCGLGINEVDENGLCEICRADYLQSEKEENEE